MFVVFKGYYCQNKKIPGIFPSIFLQPVKGSKNSILNSKSLFFFPTFISRQRWIGSHETATVMLRKLNFSFITSSDPSYFHQLISCEEKQVQVKQNDCRKYFFY